MMKIIFFGSDEFSVPALQACVESDHKVCLVITTPPQKKGRGLKLTPTEVDSFATEKGFPTERPESLKDEILLSRVREMSPDIFVVSSYGKLIPESWLNVPSRISINVHPSLLPKYRGASPLNWPILNGDPETGLSIMEVVKELDAGDVFYQESYPLAENMDSSTLAKKLAELSGPAVKKVLRQIEDGTLQRKPQDEQASTYARKLSKEDGLVDWTWSAQKLSRHIYGLKPWPYAYVLFEGAPLQLHEGKVASNVSSNGVPGKLIQIHKNGTIHVDTGEGVLEISEVKPAGKKQMKAADFVRGRRLEAGYIFSNAAEHGAKS